MTINLHNFQFDFKNLFQALELFFAMVSLVPVFLRQHIADSKYRANTYTAIFSYGEQSRCLHFYGGNTAGTALLQFFNCFPVRCIGCTAGALSILNAFILKFCKKLSVNSGQGYAYFSEGR